ncbi:MAG TPA: polysaccharide deacetylase family protein [Solirubrobacteraceae bacterium]|jgi:peptidoglycan/xylan/chitin deacetylase (PgdA/CDA1 family)|nr:polysaccharide deacetylase family protein [Solirubrobacteraceae bacterium]
MPRRWNWDFEDRRAASRPSHSMPSHSPPPTREKPSASAYRIRIRRRRGIAAVVLLVLLILILVVVALPGSHHARAMSTLATRSHRRPTQALTHEQPLESPDAAVRAVLAYTPFVKEGSERGRDVALTFDDGPGPYTPGVLSVLERLHVHATFFVIGEMLRYFSAAAERELRDGDVIGDHTETHPEMATLSAHDQYEQLFEQMARIELLGGPKPVLFRPPYGSYNATTMRELHRLHLLMILWSADTGDYLQPGVPVIVEHALAGAHPGAIILMHDAGGTRTQTIEALPTIIRELRARGYHLVTVPELLRDDPPGPGQPLPTNLRGD